MDHFRGVDSRRSMVLVATTSAKLGGVEAMMVMLMLLLRGGRLLCTASHSIALIYLFGAYGHCGTTIRMLLLLLKLLINSRCHGDLLCLGDLHADVRLAMCSWVVKVWVSRMHRVARWAA